MFFIYVLCRYFVAPIVSKVVVVSALDCFKYLHILELIWGWFGTNDAEGVTYGAR